MGLELENGAVGPASGASAHGASTGDAAGAEPHPFDSAPVAAPGSAAAEEPERVKPIDEAKRNAKAAKMRVRRRLEKLKAASSEDELSTLMRAELGETSPATVTDSAPAAAPSKMPPAEMIAKFSAPAAALWQMVGAALERHAPEWSITADEQKVLADGTAPLAAKYLPTIPESPEATFLVAVFVVFGTKAIANMAAAPKAPQTTH